MILSYNELVTLVKDGVITDVQDGAINAASIDVRLGPEFMFEKPPARGGIPVVNLGARESVSYITVKRPYGGTTFLEPAEFVLAHTVETFNLPDDISAHFYLKSSVARNGINQMAAVWCDAGWTGSSLTLELKNDLRHHRLELQVGMFIGQMVFHRHEKVPPEQSYRRRGRYNHDNSVMSIKP